MKVALVFHGLSGGSNDKFLETNINIDNILTNLYNIKPDIYFHTWKHKNINNIISKLKPIKYIIEDSSEFKKNITPTINNISKNIDYNISNYINNTNTLFSFYSRFYSLYKSMEIVSENYDIVIISRFDLFLKKKINILKYNKKDRLYVNKFSGEEYLNGKNIIELDGVTKNYNKNVLLYGVMDFFFIGSYNIIKKFSNIYNMLNKYLIKNSSFYNNKWPRTFSGHSFCMYHIKNNNIPFEYTDLADNVDFNLVRDNIISENTIIINYHKLINDKKYNEAIIYLLNSNIKTPNIYNCIGYIYYTYIKNIEKAIEYYTKSINIGITIIGLNSLITLYHNKDLKKCKKYCKIYLDNFYSKKILSLYNSL
jgi:hypothetical protein